MQDNPSHIPPKKQVRLAYLRYCLVALACLSRLTGGIFWTVEQQRTRIETRFENEKAATP